MGMMFLKDLESVLIFSGVGFYVLILILILIFLICLIGFCLVCVSIIVLLID